jgi:hypothetical protein
MHSESLAGYRVIRTLAIGRRANVYLGWAATTNPKSAEKLVVLKHVHRSGAASTAVYPVGSSSSPAGTVLARNTKGTHEAEALSVGAGEHIVRILDLATHGEQEQCLVLEWLPNGSLSRLLDRRETITAGEAVTMLAPLILALDDLHRRGVIHGGIGPGAVLFSAHGAPIFVGFGHAHFVAPNLSPAARAEERGVTEDWRALSKLVVTVLEQVTPEPPESLTRWLTGQESGLLEENFGKQLAESLFSWAEPTPIAFHARQTPSAAGELFSRVALGPIGSSPERPRPPWLQSMNVPDWVESVLIGMHSQLITVRRRTWVLATIAVGSFVAIASVLGTPQALVESEHEPEISADSSQSAFQSTADAASIAVTGDDPIAAVRVLLTARTQCLATLSIICLDAVAQQGSSAMVDDIATIAEMKTGTGPRKADVADMLLTAKELVLIERLGNSALIGVPPPSDGDTQSPSILVMKGKNGWLVRSFIRAG